MLVLGDNLLLTFLGWEGVGACSYFLISFWFTSEANAARRQEGVRHQPHRRLGLHARHVPRLRGASARSSTPTCSSGAGELAADHGHRHRRCCCSSARAASRPSCRSTSGCPTPWPARRRSRRSSTPPPWSPSGVYLMARVNPILAAGLRLGARRHRLGRRAHRAVRGHHRRRPERHQEGARLLDDQPARLHVPRRRLGRLRGRHLPHGHPRLLQGAAVPRRRAR